MARQSDGSMIFRRFIVADHFGRSANFQGLAACLNLAGALGWSHIHGGRAHESKTARVGQGRGQLVGEFTRSALSRVLA